MTVDEKIAQKLTSLSAEVAGLYSDLLRNGTLTVRSAGPSFASVLEKVVDLMDLHEQNMQEKSELQLSE